MKNKYKNDLFNAVDSLAWKIDWLDNNSGNIQDTEQKKETKEQLELLLEFIDNRI